MDRVELEGIEFPSARRLPVFERKGGEVAWADQPTVLDASLREVGFFVRAGTLEGVNGIAATGENQAVAADHHAQELTVRQIVKPGDSNEAGFGRVHFAANDRQKNGAHFLVTALPS